MPPVVNPAAVAPDIVIVAPLAPVACERVILDPPTSTSCEPDNPVVPDVFPPVDTPAEKPEPPPPAVMNAGTPSVIPAVFSVPATWLPAIVVVAKPVAAIFPEA